jgi:hypothetical protein
MTIEQILKKEAKDAERWLNLEIDEIATKIENWMN